jgi:(p)ppGpp synthase/HD superfamily hydrolase
MMCGYDGTTLPNVSNRLATQTRRRLANRRAGRAKGIDMKLSPKFQAALTYAAKAHAGQVRKGTDIPYVSHLLIVAGIALEFGADEEEAIAALLHDAVEDAGGKERLADIQRRFGARVAKIVSGCTDTDVTPKPPWLERKKQYVDHLRHEQDRSILLVSASDKLANARAILADYHRIGETLWSRFSGDRRGTLWYYRSLADLFLDKGSTPLAQELHRTVSLIETAANRDLGT